MGTKKLGNEYMVWVAAPGATEFAVVRGQQGVTVNRSATEIDLETKDDEGYGASAFGNKKLSLDLSIIPSLPDANGFTRLETQSNAIPAVPFPVQIRGGGLTGTADMAVFECNMYGNLDSTDFGQNSGVGVKTKLSAAAAPTIDSLK
jgi:predicted secreted protein